MVPTVSAQRRRPIVYLDESLIHHHYFGHADSLFDPIDHETTKPKHKGRRYCVIAAILDDGSDVSHLLGLEKKDGKEVKDYHAMFNHKYFTAWFTRLMDEVEDLGWRSAVFVMDNAKYHKVKPESTSKGNWKKEDMYQACLKYGLNDVSQSDLKSVIWAKLKKDNGSCLHLQDDLQGRVGTSGKGLLGIGHCYDLSNHPKLHM
ncbi:hypothetical protein H310_03168 [Aphanomyces invadans]|uniref:Tc1-like transposase DDE domain-containing protein n=1 Tax=Aphanomyces invadans TaxID=157072 RepID=A0A024UN97_9STRA|nr:hypothetical protein H310_03168 [Aphanomyces invadans]ETW07098.1 hypothetical protein H310_03168 [Aphanomyces invadans]|eukprot:XP_008865173.1 hypothetical protein H310_03168 [Aphanomyces invadans]